MEDGRTILVGAEHAISDQHMEVYVDLVVAAEDISQERVRTR